MGRSPSWTRIVFLCLAVGPLARASVPSRPAFLGAYAMRERNVAAGRVTTGGARRPEIGKGESHMYLVVVDALGMMMYCLQMSGEARLSLVGCKRNRQMPNLMKLKANGSRNSRWVFSNHNLLMRSSRYNSTFRTYDGCVIRMYYRQGSRHVALFVHVSGARWWRSAARKRRPECWLSRHGSSSCGSPSSRTMPPGLFRTPWIRLL